MKMRIKIFMLLVFSLIVLIGCSDNDSVEDGEEVDAGADTSEGGDILTIASPQDIETFDIHSQTSNHSEAVLTNMYSYLFKRLDGTEIENDLATSYEIIDDNVWEFELKDGITFHNGDPLTSEDIKFTFERVANDESLQRHSYFNNIAEVEIIDELTFRILTKETDPILLNKLSRNGSGILPKDYIEEHGMDNFMENPIGSGPYQFKEWSKDSHITLVPFEDHFEVDDHEWEEVVFRVIPETSTRVGELISGGVDIISTVPPVEIDRINENDGTSVVDGDSTRVMLLITRHTDGSVTSNPRVREAIDYAIDNEVLTEQIVGGAGVPTRTAGSPGITGTNYDLYDTYLYDPEYAKELLAEAGYEDGLELTLHSPQGRYTLDSDVAQVIAPMLEEVGISVNVDLMEDGRYLDTYDATANEELFLIGLSNSLFDAQHHLNHFYSETYPGRTDYYNEEFDDLITEVASNMDLEERDAQLQELQKMVAEDRPYIYLYQAQVSYGIGEGIDFVPPISEHYYIPNINKE